MNKPHEFGDGNIFIKYYTQYKFEKLDKCIWAGITILALSKLDLTEGENAKVVVLSNWTLGPYS
jgi:hypothetical protein